jgi:hypothetical protein
VVLREQVLAAVVVDIQIQVQKVVVVMVAQAL